MAQSSTSNSEEQALAAVAHASAIAVFLGPLIPALIWVIQRKKSPYVAFHALQAMGYQMLSIWLLATVLPVAFILFPFVLVFMSGGGRELSNPEAAANIIVLGTWGILLGAFGLYAGIALAAALYCLVRRDFQYPFIGAKLGRLVGYSPAQPTPLTEEGEDRFLAAIAHSTAIITLWGILFPALVWASEKERSPFLRFQALQAAIFQAIGTLAYFIGTGLYMLLVFGMMAVLMIGGRAATPEATIPAAALIALPVLCLAFVGLLLGPLYFILASWAALRILRGRDYRYPVLGNFLARRQEASSPGRAGSAPGSRAT